MTPLSGVRISWLIVARNRLLASLFELLVRDGQLAGTRLGRRRPLGHAPLERLVERLQLGKASSIFQRSSSDRDDKLGQPFLDRPEQAANVFVRRIEARCQIAPDVQRHAERRPLAVRANPAGRARGKRRGLLGRDCLAQAVGIPTARHGPG
jgi:hypothetical protein